MYAARKKAKKILPFLKRKSHAGKIALAVLLLVLSVPAGLAIFTRTALFERTVMDKLHEWARENVDGKVGIKGIRFELLPPRIYAVDVTVADRAGRELLTSRQIEITPTFLSLVRGKVDFDEIALTMPCITLAVKDGKVQNLPALKKKGKGGGPVPLLETLSIINGRVDVTVQGGGVPWDVEAHVNAVNLDLSGAGNRVFEVRLLAGKGSVRLGELSLPLDRLETRTTVDLKEDATRIKVKYLSLAMGDISAKVRKGGLRLEKGRPFAVRAQFSTSSPLSPISTLVKKVPALKGTQACDGSVGWRDKKLTLDVACELRDVWVKRFEVGTLSGRASFRDGRLALTDATLLGGGGALRFDASLDTGPGKELDFKGVADGVEISQIFHQVTMKKCGAFFRAYGPIAVKGSLAPIALGGDVDLQVKGFKAYTRDHADPQARVVVDLPRADVKSPIEITSKWFRFKNARVAFGASTLLTDTKIVFNKTLDIAVTTTRIDTADLGSVAGVPIRGSGSLKCTVTGRMKSPTVRGSGALLDFSLAGIDYGDASFRLEYAGQSTIRIPEMKGRKGKSEYAVTDASVKFRPRREGGIAIAGSIASEKMYLSDVRRVFRMGPSFLDHFETMAAGTATVAYQPQARRLLVDFDLRLAEAKAFTERFSSGALRGQWSSGELRLDELTLAGDVGRIEVRGRKGKADDLDMAVAVADVRSGAIGAMDFAKAGIGFTAAVETAVTGTLKEPLVENARVALREVRVGTTPKKDGVVVVNLAKSVLHLSADLLDGAIAWSSTTALALHGESSVTVDVDRLRLGEKDLAALSRGALTVKAALLLDGRITASGKLGGGFRAEGKASFSRFQVSLPDYELANELPLVLAFTQSSLGFERVFLAGEGTKVNVTGEITKKGPALSLQGDVDMKLLKRFTSAIESAQGTISPRLLLSGTWKAPYFYGQLDVDGTSIRIKPASLHFTKVAGTLTLDYNTIAVHLAGNVSGGTFLADGAVELQKLAPVSYELFVEFNDVDIRLTEGMPVGLEGKVSLRREKGEGKLARVGGDIWITNLRYTKDFILSQQVEDIFAQKGAKGVASYDEREENFILDIDLHGTEKLSVDNNVATADFRIDDAERPFKLTGTDVLPVMYGVVVVSKGSVEWQGKTFKVERGVIDFSNPVKTEAHFDVTAAGEIKDHAITLHAIGTPGDFRVYMSSEPELPEEDIILLIQFGMTREEMSQIENAQTVAAEVTSQAIGLDTKVKQLIPIIDQFQITTELSKQTSRVEPRITVGKYLTDKIKLSAATGLTDTSESLEKGTYFKAVLEYKVTDSFSVQAAYDNMKGTDAGALNQQFGNIGVDIKWRIEF